MGRKFEPQNWERLLSDERRSLLDPGAFLDRIGVPAGCVAADLGAGPGYFTGPLADRVGPAGRVYAVDVSPEMVAILRRQPLPPQVTTAVSGENELPVPDGSVAVALLAFVLHELDDPAAFLAEVRRILAADGRFVVLERVPQREEMGPPPEERIPLETAAAMLERAGFTVVDRGAANASNYFVLAESPRSTGRSGSRCQSM